MNYLVFFFYMLGSILSYGLCLAAWSREYNDIMTMSYAREDILIACVVAAVWPVGLIAHVAVFVSNGAKPFRGFCLKHPYFSSRKGS